MISKSFGLVSALLLGAISLPVQAQTENVQNGTQDAVIVGDNNQITQIINQTIINHPGRRNGNQFKDKKNKPQLSSGGERHFPIEEREREEKKSRNRRHNRD